MILKQHLFKNKVPLLNRALDTYALRQRTISKNIANATSPRYRPEKVKFEEYFQQQQLVASGTTTNEKHIPIGQKDNAENAVPEIENAPVPRPEIFFSGENHVNIDKEMSELAQNQIRFRFASQRLREYFQGIQSAITGIAR